MTLSTTAAATAAQTLWQGGQQADDAFWSAFATWVSSQTLEKGDLITLLNAVRDLCDGSYAGPYTLPQPPGANGSGPILLFAAWADYVYCQCTGGSQLGNVLAQLAVAGVRRDAACDIARLVVSWQQDRPIFQSPIPVIGSASGSEASTYVSDGLTIAGSVAFAVPVVGPYMGAALQTIASLVKLFFPAGKPPSMTSVIEKQLDQADISVACNDLAADAGSLSEICDLMSTQDVPLADAAPWIVANVQEPLIAALTADTPTDVNLLTLIDFVDAPGVLEFLSSGISTYLAICRQLVSTDLALAASAQANVDTIGVEACLQQVASSLLDLSRLQQAIGGVPGGQQTGNANWAGQFNALLLQVAASRLSQIKFTTSSPYAVEYLGHFVATINDSGSPAGTTPKTLTLPWRSSQDPTSAQNAAMTLQFLQTTWSSYVSSVASALDALYSTHFALISSWMQSLTSWSSALPLPAADWAPSVIAWAPLPPQSPVWVPGAQVRYAAINANENGIVTPGPWTDWLQVSTAGCPTLQLQAPSGNVKSYWVIRQILPAGSAQAGPAVCVGTVQLPPWQMQDTDVDRLGLPQAAPAGRVNLPQGQARERLERIESGAGA